MSGQSTETRSWRAGIPPVAVGVLLLLYGLGLFLMSDGEAEPALILLAACLGAGAIAWGAYVMRRNTD